MVAWVAVAGGLGALARFAVHGVVQSRATGLFPYGTVVVNISGSLALGFLTGLVLYQGASPDARTVIGTGFLGAYTTFSSFAYENLGLLRDGAPRAAFVNAFGSVAVGLLAAAAGLGLAGLL
ncbi:MAG: fluoride efflux transporter CrcB [Acidimicrobiia bacterium]